MIAPAGDAYLGTLPARQTVTLATPRDERAAIKAKYDAASDSVEFANYWAAADAYDADSANSKAVRTRLVKRSRYETANNAYADGICQTHANFVVGIGPTLQADPEIKADWASWSRAVGLRRKLWCAAHAKIQDGEAVLQIVSNQRVRHAVKLDIVPIECDQVTTPYLPHREVGVIDGMVFDRFGNVLWYDILPQHPGGMWAYAYQHPVQVPARYVCHWFALTRPGQHRGIPELTSTLQVGASSRRWREATVSAAETAASFAAIIQTDMPPGESDPVRPLTTAEIERRMMTAVPMGWKAEQMIAQHPNASYETFNRAQIQEQARPKNMPYNMAACDSSMSNYASGRLDFQPYFAGVDIERADCDELVLDKIFAQWWKEYSLTKYRDERPLPSYSWDWPNHPVADISAEASATDTKLRNGTLTISQAYADQGDNYEQAIERMANDYGVSSDEMKTILRHSLFNGTNQLASIEQAKAQQMAVAQQANKPAGAAP